MILHGYISLVLLSILIHCSCNTINCLGHAACRDQTLNCNVNEPCIINCDSQGGQRACGYTNIYQNGATTMTINCLNWKDCVDNYIHCGGAGSCTLNCGNSNGTVNQCQGSDLLCGTGPCNIYCFSSSCTGLYTPISINTGSAVSFQCTGDCSPSFPASFSSPTKKPTPNPTSKATAKPSSNPVANPTKTPTKNPTPSPTVNPTKYPTKNPTPAPTSKPTQNPSNDPTLHPTTYPTPTPTLNPSESPTKYPTESPTKYPSKYPTKYPSKYPTKYPTYQPTTLPTGTPTMGATLSTMSSRTTIDKPTTSLIVSNSPTKTPVEEGVVGVDTTKVLMDYDLEDDDNIVINDTKGILIGVSISTTLFISGCFIWGICVLCKKKRRSIRKRKKLRSDTNSLKISMDSTQVIMDGIYGHRMTADFDVTNINIANSHNAQFSPEEVERYLSDAQKEQLYKAAGGSSNCNSNVELQGDDSRTDASLSDAQKEEMRENEGIIPHSEGGPLPRREPNLRREPTTADVDHLMMKDESDNDVVQHVDTPFGPRLSPIVLGNTHVGDTDDGPEDGEFFEIVYDEGEYIE